MTPNKLPPLPEHVVTVDSADLSHLVDFMFSRFGSVADARELPDSLIAPIRRMESALAEYAKAADDLRVYPAAEALRQSQSLPAGAVSGSAVAALLADWRNDRTDFAGLAEEVEQALQADAREKGDSRQLEALISAGETVGAWLAAAIDDPVVCVEMKRDADRFLHALDPFLGGLFATQPAQASEKDNGETNAPDHVCAEEINVFSKNYEAGFKDGLRFEAAHGIAGTTHPQPVTPAGGEVVAFAWGVEVDFSGHRPNGRFLFDDKDEATAYFQWREGSCNKPTLHSLYLHPPVADAALGVVERKIKWRNEEIERLRGESIQVRTTMEHIRLHEACLRDLYDVRSALNQRGGEK